MIVVIVENCLIVGLSTIPQSNFLVRLEPLNVYDVTDTLNNILSRFNLYLDMGQTNDSETILLFIFMHICAPVLGCVPNEVQIIDLFIIVITN